MNWRRRSRFHSSSSSYSNSSSINPPHSSSRSEPPFRSLPRPRSSSPAMPTALFDHEKLDVYQLELSVIAWLTDLFEELRDIKGARLAETLDQLDRASLSSLLNTAEGNGKRVSQLRARFFDDARGSATECAACLDALVAKRACSAKRVEEGKAMLARIVSMLTKLVDRFDDVPGASRALESRTSSSRRTRTKTGGYEHG